MPSSEVEEKDPTEPFYYYMQYAYDQKDFVQMLHEAREQKALISKDHQRVCSVALYVCAYVDSHSGVAYSSFKKEKI